MATRRNRRRVEVGQILQLAFLVVFLAAGLFLLGVIVGARPPSQGRLLSYAQFEQDVRDKVFSEGVVDGNVVVLHYRDDSSDPVRVEAPDPSRAVTLMLKYGVDVKARRPVPASGLTAPVLVALLIPYGILAFYGFGLIRAAAGSAEFEWPEVESGAEVEADPEAESELAGSTS